VQVHVSVGVAGVAGIRDAGIRDATADTLLRNADLAMYLAKAQGKNRVVVYADGMAQEARDRAELGEALSGALATGQLAVHYQPVVSLDAGTAVGHAEHRITGYEALLRWQHPERGAVSPVEFIPLAEESGLIVPIGAWVLAEAARQAVEWSVAAGRPVGMAVNLSPRQLADDDVVGTVAAVLRETGLPPRQLTLEVTESILVQDIDRVVDRLHALRTLGVRIAIDDFGTGFSSFDRLRRFPADVIKIDRSFVAALDDGPAAAAIVRAMIDLARALGSQVVAEGVEQPEQAKVLVEAGCARLQGWLFAPARPAPEISALLGSGSSLAPATVVPSALVPPARSAPATDRARTGATEAT
jgi:EAL domain-containing protein (putative c-di-GMP-specific phosphodiesterase class I)